MDQSSKCGQKKLMLKSNYYINGLPRVNALCINKFDDGYIMLYLSNGKNKETGKERNCSILLNKNDVKLLKEWINEL